MKPLLIILSILISFTIFSQEKGASPIPNTPIPNTQSQTYAVVVGISDYQDEAIPDLRFADKDAEAFAAFLQSPAGGSLDEYHLKLLTNEEATMGEFVMALDWLMEVAQKGSKVIIYFSGHGDVEKKSFIQPGFLLCYDAPAKVYMSGGTFSLLMLKDVISSLSMLNEAEVIIVTDACRSGKLSGSSIGGAQATASSLSQQYANEIKILSCQPNEFSIEGEQWGGGRGAFSYHLVNGLYGMADRNEDLQITLTEVDRYLEDHVTSEVDPISQVPIVFGNKTKILAQVYPAVLEDMLAGSVGQKRVFTAVESKGIEEDILATVDTTVQEMYQAFKQCLRDRIFLEPLKDGAPDAYADAYYLKLIEVPELERLYSTMRRNYAAALLEKGQQYINGLLDSDVQYCYNTIEIQMQLLELHKTYIERTLELLGNEHYMSSSLLSTKYFYQGLLKQFEAQGNSFNPKIGEESLKNFREALTYQPESPAAWIEMAYDHGVLLDNIDSAMHYVQLAMDAVPDWLYVFHIVSQIHASNADYESAKAWLDKAIAIDSSSFLVLSSIADFYQNQGEEETAVQYFEIAIAHGTPSLCNYIWLGKYYHKKGELDKTEKLYKKAAEVDANSELAYSWLNYFYDLTNQYEKAEAYWTSLIEMDSNYSLPFAYLGSTYLKTGKVQAGESLIKKAMSMDPENSQITHLLHLHYLFAEKWNELMEIVPVLYDQESFNKGTVNRIATGYLFCNKYDEAKRLFETDLKFVPEESTFIMSRVLYHLFTENYSNAETILNEHLDGEGAYQARFKMYMGHVYFLTGRQEEGKKLIKEGYLQSKEVNDQFRPLSFFTMNGAMFRSTGRLDEGINLFNVMLEADDTDPLTHLELSRLYAKSNEVEKAFAHLDLSLKHGYTNKFSIQSDVNFKDLQRHEQWMPLMKKYFPYQD